MEIRIEADIGILQNLDYIEDTSSLSGIYKELAELIGVEPVLVIFKNYRGQQITFPTKLMSKEYTLQEIINEYDGKNARHLAKKHGYSERWVRQIINKSKNESK